MFDYRIGVGIFAISEESMMENREGRLIGIECEPFDILVMRFF
jgi:hypothetical protein